MQVNWHKLQFLKTIIKRKEKNLKELDVTLGVNHLSHLERFKEENFKILKQVITNKLEDVSGLSWFGRIAECKMKILPKIDFLFMMLPIRSSFFK